jgi:iron complex transport system ATP-binding protein
MRTTTYSSNAVVTPKVQIGSERVLHTEKLTIGYKNKNIVRTVGHALDLTLRPGQFVCLLGPNGAGKSTLIKTLAGIQLPLEGKVFIAQEDIYTIPKNALARKLSLVLTDVVQTGNLDVYTVLTLGRYPYANWFGTLCQADTKIIIEAARATGIEKYLDKQLDQLSDGERQKVMITRALVQDTPLIILDEPTAHLDLPSRVEVMRLLRIMARQTNKAIILSTHELDLALQAADTIWLMMPNQSLISGAPEDLIINGTFEKAFSKTGFDFCRDTGTFRVNSPVEDKIIQLTGEGYTYFWTKRALEREGYRITDEAEDIVSVQQSIHICQWTLNRSGVVHHFNAVEMLLIFLRTEISAVINNSVQSIIS